MKLMTGKIKIIEMGNESKRNPEKSNAPFYGVLAGAGLLFFYIGILTLFENFGFALSNFKSLWYWVIPLAVGFGAQVGLYTSIKHHAMLNAEVAASGGISGGSMIACCSHFVLNAIPFIGLSGLSVFLMTNQKWFFGIGIIANLMGIVILLKNKIKMKGGIL